MKPGVFLKVLLTFAGAILVFSDRASAQAFDGPSGPSVNAMPVVAPFVREQMRFTRVRDSRETAEESIIRMFRAKNIEYPAAEIYLRIFKYERELEVWVREPDGKKFEMLQKYPICALAGVLGPKRTQGDRQVPEGFYEIDGFNPNSSFHLSLRIDYPNERDRAVNGSRRPLGGDIFIHGGCKSEGCLAITDAAIEELYWLALNARAYGQERIPVHIFPARLDDKGHFRKVVHAPAALTDFWDTLKPGYDYFQKTRKLPAVAVDDRGQYRLMQ